jgi:hypothetical protein
LSVVGRQLAVVGGWQLSVGGWWLAVIGTNGQMTQFSRHIYFYSCSTFVYYGRIFDAYKLYF